MPPRFLKNHICALDIGSDKIAAVIAVFQRGRIQNLFCDSIASRGVQRGVIVNALDLAESVTTIIKRLKQKSGVHLKSVYAALSGKDISMKYSRAIVPLAVRGLKVIAVEDIQRVNEQAIMLGSNVDEEILHALPFSYSIDSKSGIINPVGLSSHILQVDMCLICSRVACLETLNHVISQSGYELKDICFSGLATTSTVMEEQYKKGMTVCVDVGNDITEILIFKDGILLGIHIVPMGGRDITVALVDTLKIPEALAEEIKVSYGQILDSAALPEDKEILIKKDAVYLPVRQNVVTETVTAKARELCLAIKERIEKTCAVTQVEHFVAVGRTMLHEGLLELLEGTVKLPVKLGRVGNPLVAHILNASDLMAGQKYLTYCTALGIATYVMQSQHATAGGPLPTHAVLRALHKVKEIYQDYF